MSDVKLKTTAQANMFIKEGHATKKITSQYMVFFWQNKCYGIISSPGMGDF